MQIWLARHAEAVSADEANSDFDRKLSHDGRKQTAHLARWLKDREERPELILHSPLRRAKETAEILHEELGKKIPLEECHLLAPGLRCDALLAQLAARTEQIVVCFGHQPDISRCLSDMLGGGRFGFSPGTIAGIDFRHVIAPGGGELRWLLTPEWFS